jgi:hypothetical protein
MKMREEVIKEVVVSIQLQEGAVDREERIYRYTKNYQKNR